MNKSLRHERVNIAGLSTMVIYCDYMIFGECCVIIGGGGGEFAPHLPIAKRSNSS